MRKLAESDLLSLERYARERPEFRARVMAHKKNRQLNVGPNVMWLFEDRVTVQYQVQEMLRTERIFEAEGIAEELAAYNPLIPDGTNWKASAGENEILKTRCPGRDLTGQKGRNERPCPVTASKPSICSFGSLIGMTASKTPMTMKEKTGLGSATAS